MTDWLELAGRELAAAPDRKAVSSVSAVGEMGAFKKSVLPKDGEKIKMSGGGTVKTDENSVSAVLTVGEANVFKKSESFRPHRQMVYAAEVPFGLSDDDLPLEDDDKTKAHTASPAKIAETPVLSILAVGDNGSVDQSCPDTLSEDENATAASSPTAQPSKNRKGPGEELPKLTKSLASDARDRAVRSWIIDHFRGAPLGRCIQCGETAGQGDPLFVMAAGDDVAGVHERCRALWWDRQEVLAREALGFGKP
jgi:hypothetical protein